MTADLLDDSVQPSAAGLLTLEATRTSDDLLLNNELLARVFIGLQVDLIPKSCLRTGFAAFSGDVQCCEYRN